ncbi:MAG: ZIP family metal transporter, partial [Halobacteria archaeon]|nr:ZIP family metal transporter [Halobacteria archaeon]
MASDSVSVVGLVATLLFVLLSAVGVAAGVSWKILVIGWVAFAAMAGGALLSARLRSSGGDSVTLARNLVWGYGLSSGAMITSASIFLIPPALSHDTQLGGFGVAFGIVAGFVSHTVGHYLSHSDFDFDHTVVSLTAHTVAAGAIIGVVYNSMPGLGVVLGLAIVPHKGPAGYAATRRMLNNDRLPSLILVPSAGVGVTAIASNLVSLPTSPGVNALVFGFGTGIFLHLAMDFLPRCELGSE